QNGKTLMVARPGDELAVSNTVKIDPKYVFILHGGANGGTAKNLVVTRQGPYPTIRVLQSTDGQNYSYLWTGSASNFAPPSTFDKWYKIQAEEIFHVSYETTISDNDITVCNNCPAEINGQSQRYFKLFAPTT